jgi:hypothetical protein
VTAADAIEHTGPLALVVQPDGTATAERLPENPAACLAALREAIGGHFEAIGNGRWCAYTIEDVRDLANPQPNRPADRLAEMLGWRTHPMGGMVGAVVFLGHHGAEETDVPEDALELARVMGLIP